MSGEMRKAIVRKLENLDAEILRLHNEIEKNRFSIEINELALREAELVREFLDLKLKEELTDGN